MKKLMYMFFALSLLMSGCEGGKKEREEMPVPQITVAYPLVQDITLTKDYPGYLTSEQTVNLVARVNGILQTVSFTPGTHVKKGQLLFVIEPSIYKDHVTQAEAQLKTSLAQLEYTRNNYHRMKEALKSDAVSHIQVLQAESAVTEAIAAVSNAKAALNTAHITLDYCYIRAPFNGTIGRSLYDVGSYISGAVQPVTLTTIYKDDHMYTYFNVSDSQWLSMLSAQNKQEKKLPRDITVHLGENGTQSYPATLDYLSPNVDLSTGTLNVRANLDNPKGVLKSGLYVSVTLPYAKVKQAVLVPEASIGTDQLGKYLYVVNDSNIVRYRHIEPGQLVNDTLRLITSGLSPKEHYVTTALMKVRDGMKIIPISVNHQPSTSKR